MLEVKPPSVGLQFFGRSCFVERCIVELGNAAVRVRHDIEGRDPAVIAQSLTKAFDEFC